MQGSWGIREGPSGKMPPDARPKGRTVITLNNNQLTFLLCFTMHKESTSKCLDGWGMARKSRRM